MVLLLMVLLLMVLLLMVFRSSHPVFQREFLLNLEPSNRMLQFNVYDSSSVIVQDPDRIGSARVSVAELLSESMVECKMYHEEPERDDAIQDAVMIISRFPKAPVPPVSPRGDIKSNH